jgi:hypothetical protein
MRFDSDRIEEYGRFGYCLGIGILTQETSGETERDRKFQQQRLLPIQDYPH